MIAALLLLAAGGWGLAILGWLAYFGEADAHDETRLYTDAASNLIDEWGLA